jgi:ferredoxin-nitrite reductase
MATKVYERLKDEGIKVRISFSGCTHSCGKHWVMDLGFGAIANRGNVRLNVVVGGGNKNIGKVIGSIPADKYMTVVDKFIKLVKEGEINLDNIDVDKLKKNLRDIEGFEEYK